MPIPQKEQKKLFLRSGSRCAFPECGCILTADATPDDPLVALGEMAHIVAESPDGPRGDSPLPPLERNRYANLILLCERHHALVDAQPATYTARRLHEMKREHEAWAESALAASLSSGGDQEERPTALFRVFVSICLEDEKWLDDVFVPRARSRSESWIGPRRRICLRGKNPDGIRWPGIRPDDRGKGERQPWAPRKKPGKTI